MYLFLLLLLLILFLFFLKNIYYICVRHETRYIVLSIWRFQWWRDQPTHNECIKWKYPQRCEISTYQGRQVHQGSPINWGTHTFLTTCPPWAPYNHHCQRIAKASRGGKGKKNPRIFEPSLPTGWNSSHLEHLFHLGVRAIDFCWRRREELESTVHMSFWA